jgi:hypothetical protein
MGVQAFTQLGNTVVFTANTTAPAPVQAASNGLGSNQYRIVVPASSTVTMIYLGYGLTSAIANTNATVISGSTFTLPLLPGTDEILTFLPNAYFTGITSSGSISVFITPGDGV